MPAEMADLEVTVRLHPAQEAFCRSDALYRGFVGGRGSGKSWAGAFDLLCRAIPGHTYLIASPTYTVLEDTTLPTFTALAKEMGLWDTFRASPHPTARLSHGARVRFRSADNPENLRGPDLSGIWLDEASLMSREAFNVCIGCLREKQRQGWLSATFTPKGLTHWTYEQFGVDPPRPNTAIFHADTADNPFNPPGFALTLAEQYTGLHALQELGGQFVFIQGAEWPPEYFPESIWFHDFPPDPALSVLAVDPSLGRGEKAKGCYAAIVYSALDSGGLLYNEAWMSQSWDGAQLADKVVEKFEQFRPTSVLFEGNGGQAFLGYLLHSKARERSVGLPLNMVTHSGVIRKDERIRGTLTDYWRRGELRFRDTPQTRTLINQCREFPIGDFLDGPDVLAMSVAEMNRLLRGNGKGKK